MNGKLSQGSNNAILEKTVRNDNIIKMFNYVLLSQTSRDRRSDECIGVLF